MKIRDLVERSGGQVLDQTHLGFALELLRRMERRRKLSLERGRPEIWAAAVVYVIARLNFLFDPEYPQRITCNQVCRAFGAKQGTVSQKAARVEDALQLGVGEEGLCRPEITEQFTFVQLSNGLILPKSMVPSGPNAVDDFMQGIIEQRKERRRKEAEERKARQAEAAAEKRRKWREIQPSLFADF